VQIVFKMADFQPL